MLDHCKGRAARLTAASAQANIKNFEMGRLRETSQNLRGCTGFSAATRFWGAPPRPRPSAPSRSLDRLTGWSPSMQTAGMVSASAVSELVSADENLTQINVAPPSKHFPRDARPRRNLGVPQGARPSLTIRGANASNWSLSQSVTSTVIQCGG